MQGVVAKNDASYDLSGARASVTGQTTIAASTTTTSCVPRLPEGFGPQSLVWRTPLHPLTGTDLSQIDGIGPYTALRLIAEIGTDMSRWPADNRRTYGFERM